MLNPPTAKFVVEWQAAQSAPCATVGWNASWAAVGRSTIVTPYQLIAVSCQVWQPDVIPVWFIGVDGPKPPVATLVGE